MVICKVGVILPLAFFFFLLFAIIVAVVVVVVFFIRLDVNDNFLKYVQEKILFTESNFKKYHQRKS